MMEAFIPYLTLEKIYVSPIQQTENGLYRCRTHDEMLSVEIPPSGCNLMDAIARTLACCNCSSPMDVANILQVNVKKLSAAVELFCVTKLSKLIEDYQLRMIVELARYTQMTLEETAERCGFASGSNVAHLLKRKKMPPFTTIRYRSQKTYIYKHIEFL